MSADTAISVPMSCSNPALVLVKKGLLQIENAELPTSIPRGYALIEMKAIGVCGSDVHYVDRGQIGKFVLQQPMVMGHEAAGLVLQVGREVKGLGAGDRVAIEPGIACANCESCRVGKYNLCPEMKFFATPPVDGCLKRYLLHPAHFCHRLPDHLSFVHGALCEPASVALMACIRANITPGSSVVIMGAGPIGLMCALVARIYGATFIAITDVAEARLSKAKSLAIANDVIDVSNRQAIEVIESFLAHNDSVDVVLDAAGTSSTSNIGLGITKSGGKFVSIGLAEAVHSLDMSAISSREVDIVGIFRYRHTYPTCINLMSKGLLQPEQLVTHSISASNGREDGWNLQLDSLLEGLDIARTGRDGAIKVMFML